ncbi:sigma factor-like helix-turn-helix DNA-binding protein [Nannocystis bainbridge]|uniref:Sigma factor-like helix-turn-helix DNA-binding protein n=1 Tax=Nannocystis bainbridge TaxID=2995303 RepID=A0ABT5E2I6_9BACT|nr:sigma factor-like helix-turn-helix DNA-binding protein [Nannocystis bainbridge]MDC0719638.1 sigma factor-like helix-turn-helix DNA-binding protein [Nannocystis bainbridge]
MLKHDSFATGSDLDRDSDLDEVRDHDTDQEVASDAGEEAGDADAGDDGDGPPPIVRRARAKTIAMKRLTKEELRIGALLYPERSYWRPKARGECANVSRPCPYVSCKHHLYIDVNPATGSIKINFPDLEVWELQHSCALDVAQTGGITLEEVGEILNLTRERIRQVEVRGLLKLKEAGGEDLLSYLAREEG